MLQSTMAGGSVGTIKPNSGQTSTGAEGGSFSTEPSAQVGDWRIQMELARQKQENKVHPSRNINLADIIRNIRERRGSLLDPIRRRKEG